MTPVTSTQTSSAPPPRRSCPSVRPMSDIDLDPSATRQATLPACPRKKSWPVLEIVVLLLMVKIAAGCWYILSGHHTAELISSPAASDGPDLSFLPAILEYTLPESRPKETSVVSDYLAAAAEAVSTSVAQAALPANLAVTAVAPVNAMTAGAFMVLGAQTAAGETGGRVETIPLPPGGDDLMTPAVQLPSPSLPRLAGEAAPLPPDNSMAFPNTLESAAMQNVREREQALARREALLATKEEALSNLETELAQRLSALEASRSEIETMTRRNEATLIEMKALREQQKKEDDVQADARIQHLVIAYKGMKADQAGMLINSMDDDVAVAILSAMPGRNAGLILANVSPEKAARLTKAISERRIDPNLLLADNPPLQ